MDGQAADTVLVVEDDELLRQLVSDALAIHGYRVAEAANGAAALQAVAQRRPCAILLDLRMPVMDGATFARRYREQPDHHAPIIVMTAEADSRLPSFAPDGFLRKPFNIDELLRVVRRYCHAP